MKATVTRTIDEEIEFKAKIYKFWAMSSELMAHAAQKEVKVVELLRDIEANDEHAFDIFSNMVFLKMKNFEQKCTTYRFTLVSLLCD